MKKGMIIIAVLMIIGISHLSLAQNESELCPREGLWDITNETGKVSCTGTFSIGHHLPRKREKGFIKVLNNCQALFGTSSKKGKMEFGPEAKMLAELEEINPLPSNVGLVKPKKVKTADILVKRVGPNLFKGTVGGSEGDIPMVIEYTLRVQNPELITGKLESEYGDSGTTCHINRDILFKFIK